MNIFVGSLPFSIKETDLKELFEEFGEVASVKIISDKFSGRSKGFGFIDMPNDDNAQEAINGLNGKEVDGRKIVVNKSEPKSDSDRSRRSYGERGDNRGGYGSRDGNRRNNGGNRRGGY